MSFYVKIKNLNNKEIIVQVPIEIYNIFEEESKEKERMRKEQERHRDEQEVESDEVSYHESLNLPSMQDTIEYRSEIESALEIIKTCTQTQQRRFHLHRILGYSLTEIAQKENCSKVAVKKSVEAVKEKIKK